MYLLEIVPMISGSEDGAGDDQGMLALFLVPSVVLAFPFCFVHFLNVVMP